MPHWDVTSPRLHALMTRDALLAIIEHGYRNVPWEADLRPVVLRHSRSPDFDPDFSVPATLSEPVHCHIEQFHSTASLARRWMDSPETAEFDAAIATVVAPYAADGMLETSVAASLTWGRI